MTYELRQGKAHTLIGLLASRIAEMAPEEIHGRPGAAITDGPTAKLVIALTAWEVDPSDRAMQRVTDAYEGVLEAWRCVCAAAAYTGQRSQT